MEIILALIIGIVVGFIIAAFKFQKWADPVGTLRIDKSDPDDKPYLFLELTDNIDKVYRNKYVTFKVNTQSYIPHK